jgi:HpaII restriction endonuclease
MVIDDIPQNKQNKGEWSEFYALIQLLSQGYVDMETSTDPNRFKTKVLSVSKDGIDFFISENDITSSAGVRQSREHLRSISTKILTSILQTKSSFFIPEAEQLSKIIGVTVKKQASSSVADIFAKLRHEDRDANYDLSVKSWLGSNPSFFNASKNSTRIQYKICGEIPRTILLTLSNRKATSNVKAIYSNGGYLELIKYTNSKFVDGLEFVGNDTPEFLADLVITGFLVGRDGLENSVKKELPSITYAFDHIKSKYSLFKTIKTKLFFEQRIKNLLYNILMYQLQSGPPESISSVAPDNYLAVLSDGNLLCIVGRAKLQEKLFNLCKMDSPASGPNKHDYGNVYEVDGMWAIDLHPGIRLSPPK